MCVDEFFENFITDDLKAAFYPAFQYRLRFLINSIGSRKSLQGDGRITLRKSLIFMLKLSSGD